MPSAMLLRVAILSPLPPQKTGESPYTERLIRSLLETERVRILAIAGPDTYGLQDNSGRLESALVWRGQDIFYPIRLLGLLKRWRPHLLHVQFGPHGQVYGGMYGEWMLFLLLLCRLIGIPTTMTLHSTFMPNQVLSRMSVSHGKGVVARLAVILFRMYMRLLDWSTSSIQLSTAKIDSTLRRRFIQEFGLAQEKVLEIPHPCRTDVTPMERDEALKSLLLSGRDVILVFGFIRRGKGIEVAIRAMPAVARAHPNALLLIAGSAIDMDGQKYLVQLKALVRELHLETHVRFDTLFIPEESVRAYFCGSQVLLLPYVESVGASGPMHNQAAFGVPMVASDAGLHMSESLGGNIILFRTGDSDDLASKLISALDCRTHTIELGRRIRAYALREGWDVAARRTLSNYAKTLPLLKSIR
ncbi:MAG: glycosyltransferase [Candidatus Thorarchaeota archaeon]|nr:glycosyltransferase [Candidatus Thorarchaeota archaeon]